MRYDMSDNLDSNIIILKVDASISLEVNKDNSAADGKTVNTAIASLDNGGDFVPGIVFTFEITEGNAVFVANGEKKANINANPAMVATADFTDTIGETGKIIVYPTLNNTLVADAVPYTFKSVSPPVLKLKVDKDNALSNGTDFDLVTATLTRDGGQKLVGQGVTFSLPSNDAAVFETGQTKKLSATTGNDGTATAIIIRNAAGGGTVTVTCVLDADGKVSDQCDVHFAAVSADIISFSVSATDPLGYSNNGKAARVFAEIIPSPNNPVTNCLINFSTFGVSGIINNYVNMIGEPNSVSSGPSLMQFVQIGNTKTTIPVDVSYKGPEEGSVGIQAALVTTTQPDKAFALSTPNARVDFINPAPPPPPPPPPSPCPPPPSPPVRPSYTIQIDAVVDNIPIPTGRGDIARVTVFQNGRPLAGALVQCSLVSLSGNTSLMFALAANEIANLVSPPQNTSGLTNITMRTNTYGWFEITFAQWFQRGQARFTASSNGAQNSRNFNFT
ncbi:surface protein [Brucella neotomae]|uniref:surface protein n=1 Tax=Brucella neotomae TaxID=29460 RepID=UPI000DD66E5B|nr:surface protein [Brucella neotomae]